MEASKHLYADLKGLVRGELLFDDISRRLYASDASLFEVVPAGVVAPADEEDLQALVRYAAEHQVALIPRGGGTGLAGAALGAGVVLDFSRHFGSILEIKDDSVRVQPGVPLRRLNAALAAVGRRFLPDPLMLESTVGGMLATNASGPRAHRRGTIREQVISLRAVLDTGDAVPIARASRWPSVPGESAGDTNERLADILSSTATLLAQNEGRFAANEQPRVPLDRVGYHVRGVLRPQSIDLPRLLVGSEGTLALFTEATLATAPLPAGRSVVLLGFARLDAALRAIRPDISERAEACDILDRRLLRLARGEALLADLVPEGAEAVLLVEYEADSPEAASALGWSLADRLYRRDRLAIFARVAQTPEECERFWRLRESALPGLLSLRGAAQPVPVVEDVAVPRERLPEYLRLVQDVLRRHETMASFLIHPLLGQVHMRPFLRGLRTAPDPLGDANRLWALADEVYGLVFEVGGTISSRHGTGLARLPWVGRQLGPLTTVFRAIKAIFDPRYLFNPGKIIPSLDQPATWPLRRGMSEEDAKAPSLGPSAIAREEAVGCNGCGACRVLDAPERMCPIYRVTREEAATPRAKANLMRWLQASDAGLQGELGSDEVRRVADLCVNCKMCSLECPSKVKIPRLMLEAKVANVAQHGLGRGDWALSRMEDLAALGSALAPIVNPLLENPAFRWVVEWFVGVSRRRRLPRFATPSFLRRARRRGWTRKPRSARPRVAYFVDVFANYNDPLIGEAVVAVLHHNGIEVYVPPGQVGCGMAQLVVGDVDGARDMLHRNFRLLADLAREDIPIICSEPTAALMFRHDALDWVDDSDARFVAAQLAPQFVELTAYLWDLHQQSLLRTDFQPLDLAVGHHVPCHLKALGRPAVGPALLSLIPGLRVQTIDVSCSGMAGSFGLRSENYELSLQAGGPMLAELSRPGLLFGSTECSACRLQMEEGSGKRTLHPVQYLALAYGLLPQIADQLRQPAGRGKR